MLNQTVQKSAAQDAVSEFTVKRIKDVADGLRHIQEFDAARMLDEYAALESRAPAQPSFQNGVSDYVADVQRAYHELTGDKTCDAGIRYAVESFARGKAAQPSVPVDELKAFVRSVEFTEKTLTASRIIDPLKDLIAEHDSKE